MAKKRRTQKIYFDDKKKVKKEIRVIGIDDSPFSTKAKGEVLVIGTIHRGGGYLEGVLSTHITIDGDDSTAKIARMINKSRHKDQLQCIMTDGVAVGGFNVINILELAERTKLPVIVVIRYMPNIENIKKAIVNVPKSREKLHLIKTAGSIKEFKVGKQSKIYFQAKGIKAKKAREIIKVCITTGHIPEPIRTAHLMAAGIVEGESKGRA